MRKGDRKILEGYNEVAKEVLLEDTESANLERLEQVLDWKLEKAAGKQQTSKETQEAVYHLQEEKQKIMQGLHEQLRCLDDPECREEPSREDRVVHGREDRFYLEHTKGRQYLSLGELLTDGDWGITYYLDSDSVSRDVRKRYIVSDARRKIQHLLDGQLIDIGKESEAVHHMRRDAYRCLGIAETDEPGHIAERMARTLFERLAIDGYVPLRVLEADAYEDVEHKIDFILRRADPLHRRGVGVDADDTRSFGVQFTKIGRTGSNKKNFERKQRQVKVARELIGTEITEVDDIVFVSVPGKWNNAAFSEWNLRGQASGGPLRHMDGNQVKKLFTGTLQGMFSKEEIQEMWERIEPSLAKKPTIGRKKGNRITYESAEFPEAGEEVETEEQKEEKKAPMEKTPEELEEAKEERRKRKRERFIQKSKQFEELAEGAVNALPDALRGKEIRAVKIRVETSQGAVLLHASKGGNLRVLAAENPELAEDLVDNGPMKRLFEILDGREYKSAMEALWRAA